MKKIAILVFLLCSVAIGAEETYKSLDGTIEIKIDIYPLPIKLEIIHNGTPLLKDKVVEFGGAYKCELCYKTRIFIYNPANKKARCEVWSWIDEPIDNELGWYEKDEPKVKRIMLGVWEDRCKIMFNDLKDITKDEQGNYRKFFITDKGQDK